MFFRTSVSLALLLSALMGPFITTASSTLPASSDPAAPFHTGRGSSPLLFVQNVGQFDPRVRFQARTGNQTWWFTDDGIWLTVVRGTQGTQGTQGTEGTQGTQGTCDSISLSPCPLVSLSGVALRLTVPGLPPAAHLVPGDPQPAKMNYFQGSDASRWRSNVPTFGSLVWQDVAPGVDLVVSDEWVVVSHYPLPTTPYLLHLRVDGADRLWVDRSGRLMAETAIGPVPLPAILTTDGQPLTSTVDGNMISLSSPSSLSSASSASSAFIHHPHRLTDLAYSTFLGGSANDSASSVRVRWDGYVYVAGTTDSPDFPTLPGEFWQANSPISGDDIFVTELTPDGTGLVYSTLIGGTDADSGGSLALASDGTVDVTGSTSSSDFPTTPGVVQPQYAGNRDGYVLRLDANGSLLFSTYLGGELAEDGIGMALDLHNSIYLTGRTESSNFPTTPGAFDTTFNGGIYDIFVSKLDDQGTSLVYSTLIGGYWDDSPSSIAVDGSENAYITGTTWSDDYPTTPGAFDRWLGGTYFWGGDALVTKLDPSGSGLVYSTFLGGSDGDLGASIAVDRYGLAYVTGYTASPFFPTTPGAYDTSFNRGYAYRTDGFVTKFNSRGSRLLYSTFLGGRADDFAHGIAIDIYGAVYVTGFTYSSDFPTTPGAYDTSFNGLNIDVFASRLSIHGDRLVYSTFLGGTQDETAAAIALDADRAAYIVGYTSSDDFPTTPGVYDTTYNGPGIGYPGNDAFVAKLFPHLEQ